MMLAWGMMRRGTLCVALWPVSLPRRVYSCGGRVLRLVSAYLHVSPLAFDKLKKLY